MREAGEQVLGGLLTGLLGAGLDLDGEGIADALWLAQYVQVDAVEAGAVEAGAVASLQGSAPQRLSDRPEGAVPVPERAEPVATLQTPRNPQSQAEGQGSGPATTTPIAAPAAKALREARALGRALRPLHRKVKSQRVQVLDEDATATRTAERRLCLPVMRPAPERWLELALVVEDSRSSFLWERTIQEWQGLLEHQGAFRDVRTWRLQGTDEGTFRLLMQRERVYRAGEAHRSGRSRSPKELLDPAGRRLILLVSDCTSSLWQRGSIAPLLETWGQEGRLTIVQLLPERLWKRTGLGLGTPARLSSLLAGVANAQLQAEALLLVDPTEEAGVLKIPVVTLEPGPLRQWARVMTGAGKNRTAGVLLGLEELEQAGVDFGAVTPGAAQDGSELVQQFKRGASPTAQRLAAYMAAVPVSPPITDLIRETLLPGASQAHVAEVYMGGLMQRVLAEGDAPADEPPSYDFRPGVREVLVRTVLRSQTEQVLEAVSGYLARKFGLAVSRFLALLVLEGEGTQPLPEEVRVFAWLTRQTLRQFGERYARFVGDESSGKPETENETGDGTESDWPEIEEFEFTVARIVVEEGAEPTQSEELETFEFETVRVDRRGQIQERETRQGWRFVEPLGEGVELRMVAISGGTFLMGSPKGEPESFDDERPQHEVTVGDFFIGQYPVTQSQWRAVAQMERVERELDLAPSDFKGADRPVEQVSWQDAQEFCARLSRVTGRTYRLPSEAEWEYACRAGTTTAFAFGEMITTELANYNGSAYAGGPKGKSHNATTPVGSFPANGWGLGDMHGNVWEWCEDEWHSNYEGAPEDGSAWVDLAAALPDNESDPNESIAKKNKSESERSRVLRGGSWINLPRSCRSAYRDNYSPGIRNGYYGFRVVCVAARAL